MKMLFPVLLMLSTAGFTQPSDFLILKKNKKPIQYFYAGSQIQFVTTTGAYRDALINQIKNDTLYLQEFLVQRLPTTLGTYIIDTAGSFRYAYHYNQVGSFGKPQKKGFDVSGSGAALLGGGVLLTLASGVSYIADKEKFSPELLVASAGLATAGYFMSRIGRKGMVIGKKYHLQYMDMTTK